MKNIMERLGFNRAGSNQEATEFTNWKHRPAPFTQEREEGKVYTFNLIVVDESGSMQSIYKSALKGMNETIKNIREIAAENPHQKHFVTLISFDDDRYNVICENTPIENVKEITPDMYRPQGCTPLFDAMGKSITDLRSVITADDTVLVTVITDGYENASHEYSSEAIAKLVDSLKNEGWMFTYIGANQDVEEVAKNMHIDHHMAFEADEAGTDKMFNVLACSRRRWSHGIVDNRSKYDAQHDKFFDK